PTHGWAHGTNLLVRETNGDRCSHLGQSISFIDRYANPAEPVQEVLAHRGSSRDAVAHRTANALTDLRVNHAVKDLVFRFLNTRRTFFSIQGLRILNRDLFGLFKNPALNSLAIGFLLRRGIANLFKYSRYTQNEIRA